jgi:hypothetical protein
MHVVIDPPLATEWEARGLIQEAAQVILKGAPLEESHRAAIKRECVALLAALEVHGPDWGILCLECGKPDVRCTCDPQ